MIYDDIAFDIPERSWAKLKCLDPVIFSRTIDLLAVAALLNMPLIVTHTLRTWQEQEALYAKGRTLPGEIVTNARGGHSWHNFGRAVDVVFQKGDGISYDGPWDLLGPIGERLGFVWGGRWKMRDLGHFEYHGGKTLAELRKEHGIDH